MKVIINSTSPYSPTQICEVWREGSDTEAVELLPGGGCYLQTSFTRTWASTLQYDWKIKPTFFIFSWASGLDLRSEVTPDIPRPPINITAIICEPLYYSQSVKAVVEMPSGKVINVTRTGDRLPFTANKQLDSVMSGEFSPTIPDQYKNSDGIVTGLGYAPGLLPNLDSQLRESFGPPQDNFVVRPRPPPGISNSTVYMNVYGVQGFFLFNRTVDALEQLLDAKELAKAYQRAWRMLFSFSMNSESFDRNVTEQVPVVREVKIRGFRVNLTWARGAQGSLLVVVVLAAFLTFLIDGRRCALDGEPNSLAAALRLLESSPDLCTHLDRAEFVKPKHLLPAYGPTPTKYTLELVPGQGAVIRAVAAAATNAVLT